MIHKPKSAVEFEENTIQLQINQIKISFESNLQTDPRPPHLDIMLEKELQEAFTEMDVTGLRNQIAEIMQSNGVVDEEIFAAFKLSDDTAFPDLTDSIRFDQANSDIKEPLPKIHVHNHKRTSVETTHQFYKEQSSMVSGVDKLSFEYDPDIEFADLGEAILENDILVLREGLKQIAKSAATHGYDLETIENYLDGNLSASDLEMFEEELSGNPQLNDDLELNLDIAAALVESDVMDLRNSLKSIMRKQSSSTKNIEEIDAFINNELTEQEEALFASELIENEDLRAEVFLLKDLNSAISERDVMDLRSGLHEISKEISVHHKNSIFLSGSSNSGWRKVGIVAAVFFVMFGISSILQPTDSAQFYKNAQLYETPKAISASRSALPADEDLLIKGFEMYNKSDFTGALSVFQHILDSKSENPVVWFYAGASLQNLGKYQDATNQYLLVINHKDNMFVEQAEWYLGLCYLKLGENGKARNLFGIITNKKGFYASKAKTMLKSIKVES